jgi:hypothetical protein
MPPVPSEARVQDLKPGTHVVLTCTGCRKVTEVPVEAIKRTLAPMISVRGIGEHARCAACKHKGARVDARYALGQKF